VNAEGAEYVQAGVECMPSSAGGSCPEIRVNGTLEELILGLKAIEKCPKVDDCRQGPTSF
jgi:hypothetical protein